MWLLLRSIIHLARALIFRSMLFQYFLGPIILIRGTTGHGLRDGGRLLAVIPVLPGPGVLHLCRRVSGIIFGLVILGGRFLTARLSGLGPAS